MSTENAVLTESSENGGNGNGAADATNSNTDSTRTRRTPPSKTLPSDRLSFEKQMAALRAFAVVYESNGGRPVSNDEAAKIINMSGSTVIVTNGFFTDTKLLQRNKDEQAFTPSPEVLAYYKTHEWDPAVAGEKLKPALERCWFAEVLIPRLKFRPYEEREAVAVLAEASSASKDYEQRLQVLLDYMVFSGVVVREGSSIKAPAAKAPDAAAPEKLVTGDPVPAALVAPPVEQGHETYTFILDPRRKRKVVLQAPHVITKKELERIRAWLEIQLMVEGEEGGEPDN